MVEAVAGVEEGCRQGQDAQPWVQSALDRGDRLHHGVDLVEAHRVG